MRVSLVANHTPCINDVTAAELRPLLAGAAQLDALLASALQEGRLLVVDSGSADPVIDLSQVRHVLRHGMVCDFACLVIGAHSVSAAVCCAA